jgi:hypothetical protein
MSISLILLVGLAVAISETLTLVRRRAYRRGYEEGLRIGQAKTDNWWAGANEEIEREKVRIAREEGYP